MAWNRGNKQTEVEMYAEPQGEIILELDEKNVVVAETSEFNGKEYFNIRKFYQNRDGEWGRGKGLSVDSSDMDSLLRGIVEFAANHFNCELEIPEKKKSAKRRVVEEEEERSARRSTKEKESTKKTSARATVSKVTPKSTFKTSSKNSSGRRATRASDF